MESSRWPILTLRDGSVNGGNRCKEDVGQEREWLPWRGRGTSKPVRREVTAGAAKRGPIVPPVSKIACRAVKRRDWQASDTTVSAALRLGEAL